MNEINVKVVKGKDTIKGKIETWKSWLDEIKEIQDANNGWYKASRESEEFIQKPSKEADLEFVAILLKRVILFQQNQHIADKLLFEGLTTVIIDLLDLMSASLSIDEELEELKATIIDFRDKHGPTLEDIKHAIELRKQVYRDNGDLPYA